MSGTELAPIIKRQAEHEYAFRVIDKDVNKEMRQSYLDYAVSVIVGRALPDARDGLKPVHRRIIFTMHEANNNWNKPYKKSARIVGDVLGKLHPHGDNSVYDAMVRMAQPFSMRAPLVDGQGNFGSIDDDPPAAMRYTEVRLTKLAQDMVGEMDFNTVDMVPNYDEKELEPTVLPSRFPNLLLNGSDGIAVGMATKILPFNLGELMDACIALLDDASADITTYIKGPDFPTYGLMLNNGGIQEIINTGRGRVTLRSKVDIETAPNGKVTLAVSQLPYQVCKANIITTIARLVKEEKLTGITHIQDESDKSGIRIAITLHKDSVPEIVLNNLFSMTQLQENYSSNLTAIVDGAPRLLSVYDALNIFIKHRKDVKRRFFEFHLMKAQNRIDVLNSLIVALDNIDLMVKIIRESKNSEQAINDICIIPWKSETLFTLLADSALPINNVQTSSDAKLIFPMTEANAKVILDMRLQRLIGMERDKLVDEYVRILVSIREYTTLLTEPSAFDAYLRNEFLEVKDKFSDPRRTEICVWEGADFNPEDLIPDTAIAVTLTFQGFIKAQDMDEFRTQNRGGRGKNMATLKDNDYIEQLLLTSKHSRVLFFTNKGRVYNIRGYDIPEGSRASRGRSIQNFLSLTPDESITTMLSLDKIQIAALADKKRASIVDTEVPDDEGSTIITDGMEFLSDANTTCADQSLVMVTKNGVVKRVTLSMFAKIRAAGTTAISLREDDELKSVFATSGSDHVLLVTHNGLGVRFDEQVLREIQSKGAYGVRGVKLNEDDYVVSGIACNEESKVVVVTEDGHGKVTDVSNIRQINRGGKGVIVAKVPVAGTAIVNDEDDLMLLHGQGIVVRMRVNSIRETGRTAKGVTLIKSDEAVKIQRVVCIRNMDTALSDTAGSTVQSQEDVVSTEEQVD
jgi:DNA gyrase subunit A